MTTASVAADANQDMALSIVEGGPANDLLRRLSLAQPLSSAQLARIALAAVAVTWVPLAVLCSVQGLALRGTALPFIDDLAAHVRFLLGVPLLILAEGPIGHRVHIAARHFLAGGLIAADDREAFARIVASTVKLRDSRVVGLVLIGLVAAYCWYAIVIGAGPRVGNWYRPQPQGPLSLAGYWYAFPAMPLFQFLLLRWIYRVIVWARFLKEIAKLDLLLTPTHPDAAGGLAFLGRLLPPFGIILFALSAVVSAGIASRVLFAGASLYDNLAAYAALISLTIAIFASPVLFFAPILWETRERGLRDYGGLATDYTLRFHQKWLGGGASQDEPLLGSADIQSLADLGNSYQLIEQMKIFPVAVPDLAMFALPAIIPALPLAATVMPMSEIMKDLMKLLT